ncbi:MAG: zinc ribbon domain-containing protein [Chloroflexi bacterium]|nr:zinc ribbon domain-containing protein [Chloroflexota bacterium]MCL5075314.1 zinc ribbon domain-containing protein [Chloroflexota bacterium]
MNDDRPKDTDRRSSAAFKVKHLRLVFLLVALLVSLLSLQMPMARAEGPTSLRLKELRVSIWPEYDDPRVLVIYSGRLADAALPAKVAFLVPNGAEIGSTCAVTSNGEHRPQPHSLIQKGDFLELGYDLPLPDFHFEYYYNPLEGSPNKTMQYTFSPPYSIESLVIEVQQPLKATNFVISPVSSKSFVDKQGFKYYQYDFSNIVPGQLLSFKMTYTKTDLQPSVQKSAPSGPQDTSGYTIVLILLLAAAVVILLFFGYSAIRSRRTVPITSPRTTRRGGRRIESASGYCSNCGAPLRKDARFCPSCGRKVKRSV